MAKTTRDEHASFETKRRLRGDDDQRMSDVAADRLKNADRKPGGAIF
jgi:hypothetical protein